MCGCSPRANRSLVPKRRLRCGPNDACFTAHCVGSCRYAMRLTLHRRNVVPAGWLMQRRTGPRLEAQLADFGVGICMYAPSSTGEIGAVTTSHGRIARRRRISVILAEVGYRPEMIPGGPRG